MDHSDLYLLRETYNQKRIILSFNGPFSQVIIEELGVALRSHLKSDSVSSASASDVFAVYIELTQNIRNYAREHAFSEEAGGTVVIGRDEEERHVLFAGNIVRPEDGEALHSRVQEISAMDKAELRAAYKAQLRRPREEDSATGAGLGLLDIARKSSETLTCSLLPVNSGNNLFFSIKVVI